MDPAVTSHTRRDWWRRKLADPEWRAARNERQREYGRLHPKPYDPIRAAARSANRTARALGIPGQITRADVAALFERQPTCVNCGVGRGLDHIVPMARGGANVAQNLQNLCRLCNTRKGAGDQLPGVSCRNGHPRTPENTAIRYICRPCVVELRRRKREANRAA